MVSKEIINKIITNQLTLKCGLRDLDKKDKELIENFNPKGYYESKKESNNHTDLYNKQDNIQRKIKFSDEEIESGTRWQGTHYRNINGFIYKSKRYKRIKNKWMLIEQIKKDIKNIDGAIDKCNGISQNTILHRYGKLEKGLKPGDVVVQKRFWRM